MFQRNWGKRRGFTHTFISAHRFQGKNFYKWERFRKKCSRHVVQINRLKISNVIKIKKMCHSNFFLSWIISAISSLRCFFKRDSCSRLCFQYKFMIDCLDRACFNAAVYFLWLFSTIRKYDLLLEVTIWQFLILNT